MTEDIRELVCSTDCEGLLLNFRLWTISWARSR
jgi:hypothetical protein